MSLYSLIEKFIPSLYALITKDTKKIPPHHPNLDAETPHHYLQVTQELAALFEQHESNSLRENKLLPAIHAALELAHAFTTFHALQQTSLKTKVDVLTSLDSLNVAERSFKQKIRSHAVLLQILLPDFSRSFTKKSAIISNFRIPAAAELTENIC